jgi:hypothetical protein
MNAQASQQHISLSVCLSPPPSGFITAIAVFQKPNTIPPCFSTEHNVSYLSPSDFQGFVFDFLALLFFNDEQGAGPLHQPPTWRAM